jgi:enolase
MLIKSISAKKIKDSRNQDTLEVTINGCKASSPSGKSTGKFETPCYHNSLSWNISKINSLKIPFEINSFEDLHKVEEQIKIKFDFKDAKQFGANALFALESAILKALAKENKKELWQIINPDAKKIPIPVGNAVGGGLHSKNKEHPDFQEFLLIPSGNSAKENFKIMQDIHKKLKSVLNSKKVNDEGAWETSFDEEIILNILSNYREVRLGLDIASTSFFSDGKYNYKEKNLTKEQQIFYINSLIEKFNIFYIEDPLQEQDFQGFTCIKKSDSHLVVGDDLTATHLDRLREAVKNHSINAMIIKPNQNGSLLELAEIFKFCKKHKIKTILSHRSGETLDSAIADYAFAFQSDFIKCGIATKWREAKLKRLIEIEESLQG